MTGVLGSFMKEIIDRIYPVGTYLDLATSVNPNEVIGYGTRWRQITDGRVLLASNSNHPLGQMCGEEQHTLNVGEIPPHDHLIRLAGGGLNDPQTAILSWTMNRDYQNCQVEIKGGGLPHNNMQPSLAVNRWVREQ